MSSPDLSGGRASWARRAAGIGAAAISLALLAGPAPARITVLDITRVEPVFGGASFGEVGRFTLLTGTAYGEVNSADPHNAIIQDIALAPRNAAGKVAYSMDVAILKPANMARGNGCATRDGLYLLQGDQRMAWIRTEDGFAKARGSTMPHQAEGTMKAQATLLDGLVNHVLAGTGTHPTVVIGPVVWQPNAGGAGDDRLWYFVCASGERGTTRFEVDQIVGPGEAAAVKTRALLMVGLVQRRPIVIIDLDSELAMARCCEAVWPSAKATEIRQIIEARGKEHPMTRADTTITRKICARCGISADEEALFRPAARSASAASAWPSCAASAGRRTASLGSRPRHDDTP